MQKFSLMLLNQGEYNRVRILSEEAVKLIMSDQLPKGTSLYCNKGYGLGGSADLKSADHTFAHEYKDIVSRALID